MLMHGGPFLLAHAIDPTGPFMLDIFGPAGPSMYPDQIFCYISNGARKAGRG